MPGLVIRHDCTSWKAVKQSVVRGSTRMKRGKTKAIVFFLNVTADDFEEPQRGIQVRDYKTTKRLVPTQQRYKVMSTYD